MQTLTRMNTVIIEDYYHMATIDENVNWMKLAHLLSNFPLNLRAPFCTSTWTSWFFVCLLILHTKENLYLSLTYTMYANASNKTPSYTHISSYVIWSVQPPGIEHRHAKMLVNVLYRHVREVILMMKLLISYVT